MSDIVERLRAHKADIWNWNGTAMTAWDGWRDAIATGDKGSWPRDAFESLIGGYGEDMAEAADTITNLRAEVERLKTVNETLRGMVTSAEAGRDLAITEGRAKVERLRAFVSVADELRDSIRIGTENKRKVIAVCDYDIARAAIAAALAAWQGAYEMTLGRVIRDVPALILPLTQEPGNE